MRKRLFQNPTPPPPPRSGEGEKDRLLPLSASGRGWGGGVGEMGNSASGRLPVGGLRHDERDAIFSGGAAATRSLPTRRSLAQRGDPCPRPDARRSPGSGAGGTHLPVRADDGNSARRRWGRVGRVV